MSTQNDGFTRKIAALLLGGIAAKFALMAIEQVWTKGLGRDIPGDLDESSAATNLLWIGITASAVALAREAVRQMLVRKPA